MPVLFDGGKEAVLYVRRGERSENEARFLSAQEGEITYNRLGMRCSQMLAAIAIMRLLLGRHENMVHRPRSRYCESLPRPCRSEVFPCQCMQRTGQSAAANRLLNSSQREAVMAQRTDVADRRQHLCFWHSGQEVPAVRQVE